MGRDKFIRKLQSVFGRDGIELRNNLVVSEVASQHLNQQHTNDAFSDKWQQYEKSDDKEICFSFNVIGILTFMDSILRMILRTS